MKIRVATPDDASDITAIYGPIVERTYISFEELVPTSDEMAARIANTLLTHPWLVIDMSGAVAAYAYAGPHRGRDAYKWSCDVSVYVAETARRQGLAKLLYKRLFAALTELGYARVFAGIALPNPASVGIHEAVGFVPIGVYPQVGFKNGAWRDVGWWTRPLQDLGDQPSPPRPFGARRQGV